MKLRRIFSLFLCSVLLLCPIAGLGFETDQYNLPPEPLADIGREVSNYVEANLRQAVASINGEIDKSLACLENPGKDKKCGPRESEQVRLATLRSDEHIVNEVYKRLGDGNIFRSKFGRWLNSYDFQLTPSRYKTGYLDSIYVALPANYWTISPTIDLYGVQFGTDKLEHFFQQGYRYNKIERDAAAKGDEPAKAIEKAVKWGQRSERTYYGLWVSGVYSNADLYSNYAGMKFYDGLTKPITIGDKSRPAIIVQNDGRWSVNEEVSLPDNLLKPFITEHLNEALNPSGYAFTIFASVKQIVRKNACPEWRKQYPELTADALDHKASDLELWNDEDYGNMEKGRYVRLSEVCFKNRL